MAAQKVVVGGSDISADQMEDFWRQVVGGFITGEVFGSFLKRRNPFKEKPRSTVVFTVASNSNASKIFIKSPKQDARRHVSDWAVDVMRKPLFVISNGVTYRLGLIKGKELSNDERTMQNIRAEARRRGWLTPPAESALLLYEAISKEDIDQLGLLRLIVMHEPIIGSDGDARLLVLGCVGDVLWLDTDIVKSDRQLASVLGFVFLLPKE